MLIAAAGAFVPMNAAAEGDLDYGRDRLERALPQEASSGLEDIGITPDNSGAAALTLTDALDYVWQELCKHAAKPLKLLAALCGVVLLCALSDTAAETGTGSGSTGGGSLKTVFSVVGVLAGAGMAITSVSEVLNETLGLLSGAASFMLAFIPIFTGIAAVLGHTASAAAVNATALAATQLFSQLAVRFLAPLCGTILGLSVTGAVNPQLNLARLGEVIKKCVMWVLVLMMTIFMSILSAQTFVANAADSAFIRTAKLVVSSGVPIVGGTIAEAVNTVQGGLVMLKSSVGTYGLVAVAVIVLPALAKVGCYRFAMLCAEAFADVFGLKELSALFKSCGAVMSIVLAVVSCFLLLNTIAVIILLSVTQ